MKTRIKQLIVDEKLTAAGLADKIGVQRSSISHILTGRNNPSLDFFQKLLKVFPDINTEWLLTGKGNMYKQDDSKIITDVNSNMLQSNLFDSNQINNEVTNVNNEKSKIKIEKTLKSLDKPIIKIVNFYKDHTFEEFFPMQ